MKAISPMIAVILLIAFTVAIGGILSVWLTGLQQQQTTATGEYAEKVAKCAGVSLAIENISDTLFQVSYESGTYDLTDVNVTVVFTNTTTRTFECASTLSPGGICVVDITDQGDSVTMENVTAARAVGFCLQEVAKVAEWSK